MPADDRLFQLLRACTSDELEWVWTNDLGKKPDPLRALSPTEQVDALSAEVRSVAGHTLGNLRRGDHDLAWRPVLTSVHGALSEDVEAAEPIDLHSGVRHLEREVLRAADLRVAAAWDNLTDEQREALALDVGALADFEQDAICEYQSLLKRIVAANMGAGSAVSMLAAGAKLLARPLAATGGPVLAVGASALAPALALHQASKLMEPSLRKLVPATLHLLQFNGVRPLHH